MKTTKILIILALTIIGLGVNAQQQDVTNGSVHKYKATEANRDASSFAWYIYKAGTTTPAVENVDYEIWSSGDDKIVETVGEVGYVVKTADIGSFVAQKYILYIKWLNTADNYTVRFEEKSEKGCFDDTDNRRDLTVNVKDNKFNVTTAWDQKPVSEDAICAVHGDNTISFTVTKEHGVFRADPTDDYWYFEYQMSVNGAVYAVADADAVDVKVDGVVKKMVKVAKGVNSKVLTFTYSDIKTLTEATDAGEAVDYLVKLKITDARDGYMAKDTDLTDTEVTATLHRNPTTINEIVID